MNLDDDQTNQAVSGLSSKNGRLKESLDRIAAELVSADRRSIGVELPILLLYPMLRFLFKEFGLPWLAAAKSYSDLQVQRLQQWVNAEYQRLGIDPSRALAASKRLVDEIEAVSDQESKKSWETLKDILLDTKRNQ